MSARRALVDCAVLSLQDVCLFYPCCKGCFSRIDVEQQNTTRCRCFKCGYSCLRGQVDYRYRLSFRVSRNRNIFNVTVFGTCLNPFFGIHASGLQRLVENFDGPVGESTRSRLLLRAVKDCFIGRHFVFGIKVTETENETCFQEPIANDFSSNETVNFIATQMILPKSSGLGGCTVVSYYQVLLRIAVESEQGSSTGPPTTTPLLIPCHSSPSSFNNGTLCSPGVLSQSPLRSKCQDSTLTSTPPWQQSLGLVTSSAEQEFGCSTQESGDENSRQTDDFKTQHNTRRGCQENHKVTEASLVQSPLLSMECNPFRSIGEPPGNTLIINPWLDLSPPEHNSSEGKRITSRQLTETFLSSSLVWEDLPISESLTAFIFEENRYYENHSEIKSHQNLLNQKETVRNHLEITSQDKNSSIQSPSVCQSSTQISDRCSQMLLDVTNIPPQNGEGKHDLSEQKYQNAGGCVNNSQIKIICSHKHDQEDEKVKFLSFKNIEEELDRDVFNYSADLFSRSLSIDIIPNTNAKTVSSRDASPVHSKLDKQLLWSEKTTVPHSTPEKQKRQSEKCTNWGCLVPPDPQDLDFIPPSQSTPILKVAVALGSPASSYGSFALGEISPQPGPNDCSACLRNMPKLDSKRPAKASSALRKHNNICSHQLYRCGGESTRENMLRSTTPTRQNGRFTPKQRFWRPDKHKKNLLVQQHLRVQRGALNPVSTGRDKCNSSECDAVVSEYEDSEEVIVPPTKAVKTYQTVNPRSHTVDRSSNLGYACKGSQGNVGQCKQTQSDQIPISSQRDLLAKTGNCGSVTVDEGIVHESHLYGLDYENEACDWSRDLFSDSV